jgi:hypothetical protein
MKSIDYLYGLVGKSNFTTIGYTSQDEKLKDGFISKLPIFRLKELGSSFSFNNIKQLIIQKVRENRIDCLLDNSDVYFDIPKFDYLVLDLEDMVKVEVKDDGYVSMHRSIQLKNLLENLRNDSIENNYKVIFTTTTYKKDQLKGGSSSMFMADLVVMFNGGVAKITKNRFGFNDEIISLTELN